LADEIFIKDRRIGGDAPVYVIAEISANHGQSLDRCLQLVSAALDAGADAVKLQTYTPDTMTIDSDRPEFRVDSGTIWDGRTLYDLYEEAHTPWDWYPRVQELCDAAGKHLFSTPFDETAVDYLERQNVPAWKIASFELVDLPLIERCASTGLPMIISTGMATLSEIDEAVSCARNVGAKELALLRTNSGYPARPEEMNLRTIADLRERFGVPVGLSDHTLGIGAAVAAVALGACIVEKHICLSRDVPGPDVQFSLEPDEFAGMVEEVRSAQKAVGDVVYGPTARELSRLKFRRSLSAVTDIAEHETFTRENVRNIRPAGGLPPKSLNLVLGRRANRAIERGTPLTWDHVQGPAS